jgi:hypothetical protein
MFELKPLNTDAIPAALDKAMRYRLLNEPGAAESICLDVLRIDSDNQQALVTLLLAMTDRLAKGYSIGTRRFRKCLLGCATVSARLLHRDRVGASCERRGWQSSPGAHYAARLVPQTMEWFESRSAVHRQRAICVGTPARGNNEQQHGSQIWEYASIFWSDLRM